MEIYLIAAIAIIALNALPAFAPPTWMALVFFVIHYEVNPIALVIIGVASATAGRGFLAWYFRKFAHLIPTSFSRNMEYAGTYFTNHPTKRYALFATFFLSPVSSAQLFEAAGLMKEIKLRPLLLAFATGRAITYSTYVSGTKLIAATNFGEILISQLKSPWAIAVQVAMIAGLIALGSIDWKKRLKR